uniref:Uncharacterized protein LOC114345379 n=1 Tax=Diabrotica virgifera virgifera TaxID=50390 RepID=A0A6P7GR00_DIAVI
MRLAVFNQHLQIDLDIEETTTLQSLDDVIKTNAVKKNLEPIKEHSERIKRAQERYYKKSGTSGVSPLIRLQKRPVKQRIGKLPSSGIDTSTPNKNVTLRNTILRRRVPRNLAQLRLNRIREQQRLQLQATGSTGNRPVIRLKRKVPNFKIQVKNNRAVNSNIKRFKLQLNEEIQQGIQALKEYYSGEKIIASHVIPEMTGILIDSRFSNLR